jgi:TolB-like protein
MKRFIALFLLLAFSTLMPFTVRAEYRKTKIAVLDFQLRGKGYETADMGQIVAEWFITALVKAGRFDVVERGLLKKILEEQELALSGIVDETTVTEVGKLLGVKVIISGSVLKLQNILEINARIIDVETASIIAAENVKSSAAIGLQDLVVQMSEKIIKNFPLEGYIANKKNTTVSIDLGRLAGVKRGMEFMVFKEGEIIKHPKTGEVLDVERIQTGKLRIKTVRDKISTAEIIEEETPGAVSSGQMIESLVGPSIPGKGRPYVYSVPRGPVSYPKDADPDVARYINMLRSGDVTKKRAAARIIYKDKLYSRHPELLEVVSEELLKGYNINVRDKNHVDAMAWLCNVLGASRQTGYKATLEEVARETRSRKLKKYAKKNLRGLR